MFKRAILIISRALVLKFHPLQALSKANQAQNKAKEASTKVMEAKKELDDIAAILSTVQEPGKWTKMFGLFPWEVSGSNSEWQGFI